MSAVATAPLSPYKGLAAFEDSEADEQLFFGRERDTSIVAANVLASRLTVLFGPSGVGKSSVLRAGVARRLRALPDVAVAIHDRWAGDPVTALLQCVDVPDLPRPRTDLPLPDALEEWTRLHEVDLVLLLDQFEELFAYHAPRNGGGSAAAELGELVSRPGLRVNVLVAVREDALATLDVLTGRVPSVFGNYVRLERLSREAGRAAILGPLGRWNAQVASEGAVEAEPALVDAVLDGTAGTNGVEAPYLQLVMQRVWEVERVEVSRVLRLETLERLGGPGAVVREHLGGALGALDPDGRDVAASVFHHLVTPSGTKIAHGLDDLAGYGGVPREELAPVLEELGRRRILRPLDAGRYEIFHDVLAEPVLAWRAAHATEARIAAERRRQQRLLAAVVASVGLLVVMTVVAIYALTQRSAARDQARTAEARAFAAGAWASLEEDPELAMLLSLEAARREPGPDVEDVLRRSLERSRLRGVLPPGELPAVLGDDRLDDESGGLSARAVGGRVEVVARDGAVVTEALHPARVRAVDLDGDGRRLLVAAGDVAYLRDARSGRLLAELSGHTADVVDARFSPDGSFIATASIDSTARLWEGTTGASLDILFGHANFLTALAFSPDGQTLATAGRDGTGRLWEVVSGRPLGVLSGHDDVVGGVGFVGEDEVVTVTAGGVVRSWDGLPEPTLEQDGPAPELPAPTAASPTGRRAVAQGAEVRLSGGGLPSRVLRGHTLDVTSVEFSRDGRLLVTASRDKDARVWDAASGDHLRLLRRHFGPVADASFSPDGRWIVTAGPIKAGLWETATGRFLFYLRGHTSNLTAAAFTPESDTVVTVDRSGETRAWRCLVCGGLEELVRIAEGRLAGSGRALDEAELARYSP